MKLHIYSEEDLSSELRQQFFDFECLCFGEDLTEGRKTKYFSKPFKHLALFNDPGQLVSYLRLFKRPTKWKNQPIMIGGVSTLPSERGKGYASELLDEAIKILKEERVDIGLLQTNIRVGANSYGKVGFIPSHRPYQFLDINNQLHLVQDKDVMLAPISDLKIIQDILHSEEILNIGPGDW